MDTNKPLHWDSYFKFLLEWEGEVYECDPDDTGGATKYGIDQRSHPKVNIKALTREGAERIYLEEFSVSLGAFLPPVAALAFFDAEVNTGRIQALKFLQRAVDTTADGVLGPVTRAAVTSFFQNYHSIGDERYLIMKINGIRRDFYRLLAQQRPVNQKYLKGWLNRTDALNTWAGKELGK